MQTNINTLKAQTNGLDIKSKIQKISQGRKIVFTTSFGEEDQVITDIVFANDLPVEVVSIDTGRLFEETYKVLLSTTEKYKKQIKVYFPEAADVEKLMTEKGAFSFYESVENRKECCHIRKVKPLERALKGADIWITGLRTGQSAGRTQIDEFEYDERLQVIKYNPLHDWDLEQVQAHIKANFVPVNALHQRGFISIGCQPCTRAIREGEDIRAGRWWWENNTNKECGLHVHSTK